jgi:carbon starvation protein
MVGAWGYFLIQGVRDPLGGINSLWPLFGIANQLLAAVALCLASTVILKMQLAPVEPKTFVVSASRSPALALITLIPLVWLLTVTMTAGYQKIWHPDPRIGFLAQARVLNESREALGKALGMIKATGTQAAVESAEQALRTNRVLHFNSLLDAVVAAGLLLLTVAIVMVSAREWWLLLSRRRASVLRETTPVWLTDYDASSPRTPRWSGVVPLTITLLKELSMEASVERAQQTNLVCQCGPQSISTETSGGDCQVAKTRTESYLEVTERRFKGVTRCC